ncbi:hypothetical protein BH10ACI3_BH10ACI3_13010 [soil metagenome]
MQIRRQRFVNYAFAVLLVLTLGANISAQSKENKLAAANKMYDDAIALFHEDTSESYSLAMKKFRTAANLFRLAGNKRKQADSLVAIGLILNNLGERSKALVTYKQALLLVTSIADKDGEAGVLANMGMVYFGSGEYPKAIKLFDNALSRFRAVGNKEGEVVTLNNLAGVYSDSGDNQRALQFYQEALPIARTRKDTDQEATILSNIGALYGDLDENQKALEYYNLSLPLRRLISDKDGEATTLLNIGAVYSNLGDYDQAIVYLSRALPLFRSVKNKEGEGTTLNNLGVVSDLSGKAADALKYFNESLQIARDIEDKSGEAVALSNIGKIYDAANEKARSIDFFDQALKIASQIGYKSQETKTLTNLGNVYFGLNRVDKAIEYYQRSLPISRTIGDKSQQAENLNRLMTAWIRLNNPRLAVFYGKQSVNLYQEIRRSIKGLDKKTQKTYLKTIEGSYRGLAELLIANGRIAEAEEVLAMLKEDEFFDYVRRDDKVAADLKSRISLSTDERIAFDQYEKAADEITRSAEALGEFEKKKNALLLGESLTAADQQKYDTLKQQYDAAVVVFNTFLNDLKVKLGTNDKRVAVVESDIQGMLKRLNQPRTAVVSTIAGEDRLNLIVTTADIQRAHTIDIKAVEINKMVAEFREAVKDPNVDPRPLGKKLYDILFPADLQKDLDGIKADTIVWSLDGTLRYVPMAALWDGKQYLVERYNNAVLTLASRDKLSAAPTDRSKWIALGVGVSKEYETFQALSAVPQELCSIIRDPKKDEYCAGLGKQPRGVFGGMMLSDDEFTLQNFENNIGKVPVVHIASHFSLNAGNENDSYLLLGGGADRRFSLSSLRKTRLDQVELLTLSACNTAMTSGENSSGVEIEGFGALAQNQGAKTILATLWSVADDSTRDVMTGFYTRLETDPKVGRAAALRKAQLDIMTGKYVAGVSPEKRDVKKFAKGRTSVTSQPVFVTDPKAPFAHPFYWAPFVLIGNWQ